MPLSLDRILSTPTPEATLATTSPEVKPASPRQIRRSLSARSPSPRQHQARSPQRSTHSSPSPPRSVVGGTPAPAQADPPTQRSQSLIDVDQLEDVDAPDAPSEPATGNSSPYPSFSDVYDSDLEFDATTFPDLRFFELNELDLYSLPTPPPPGPRWSAAQPERIDLTADSPPAMPPYTNTRRRSAGDTSASNAQEPPSKRRRISENDSTAVEHDATKGADRTRTIEEVDLIEGDNDISATLQKQLAERVSGQQEGGTKSKLTSFQCTICLDDATDLTATACGHMFCRTCLMDWLVSGEKEHPRKSNCPSCRKPLSRNARRGKPNDVICLEIKKKPMPVTVSPRDTFKQAMQV